MIRRELIQCDFHEMVIATSERPTAGILAFLFLWMHLVESGEEIRNSN